MGIRQQIEIAKTETGIKMLLAQGYMYLNASEKTKRHWEKTANNRLAELNKV